MARIGGADSGYSPVAPLVRPRQAVGSGLGGYAAPASAPRPPASLVGAIGSAAPPVSGGQSVTTTYTPNQIYAGDILSDPQAVGAQGIFNAQSSGLAAARADAIQRAIINSGYSPTLPPSLQAYAGDVTPQTLTAAAANPMSTKAQLDLQLSQANQNLPYDLAASGMGRSGAAAINQGNLQRQYQTGQYQGMQSLLDSIYGSANTYAGNYNNAVNQLAYAREQVANRLSQTAGYSQSIDTSGGDGSGLGGGGVDGTWNVPGYDVPPVVPSYGSYAGSPAQLGSTSTQQAVQRAISAIKQPAPRLGQTLRNVMAG